jgi:hypothetical protein
MPTYSYSFRANSQSDLMNGKATATWHSDIAHYSHQCGLDQLLLCEPFEPFPGDSEFAPVGPCKLSADGPRRIGIVTQIHGFENRFTEILGVVEGPDRRFQTFDDVATPFDVRRLELSETSRCHCLHFGMQRCELPQLLKRFPVRCLNLLAIESLHQSRQYEGHVAAG